MLCRRIPKFIGTLRVACYFHCNNEIKNCNEHYENNKFNVTEELVSEYGNNKYLIKLIESNPDLKYTKIFFWKSLIETLTGHGCSLKDCFKIIWHYPPALGLSKEILVDVINTWKLHGKLNSDLVNLLIISRPEFLGVDNRNIVERVPILLKYFVSQKSLMCLLILCPNIMFETWDDVVGKIDFLVDEMVVSKAQVINCKAMSKSLDFLKLRFSVLRKCGKYKIPSPYQHKQTIKEVLKLNNPTLKRITDTSDIIFATKVAKISIEEYETYTEMFELLESEDIDSDEEFSDDD